MIEVSINGEPRKLGAGTTVAGLLAELALPVDKVAVGRNLEIVPRSTFAQVALAQAKLPFAITHSPGCMLVTDLRNSQLAVL